MQAPDLRRDRRVWWMQAGQIILAIAVPCWVFALAGGDADETLVWVQFGWDAPGWAVLGDPPVPVRLAALTFLAMSAACALAEVQARRTERRWFARWFARLHPEDAPDAAVAEMVRVMLREQGPLTGHSIRSSLAGGGRWGAPVVVSHYGLLQVLAPKGKPARWLAERQQDDWPYSLREAPYRGPQIQVTQMFAGNG